MSTNPFSDNPYQSPALSPGQDPALAGSDVQLVDRDKLRKFRQQIHALGGFWILIASFVLGLAAFLVLNEEARLRTTPLIIGILLVSGVVHFALGVMTCLKQMWAVYTGLVLSYISVVGNLLNLNICALVILAVVIFQAHRVIKWAKELRLRGVSLTAKA